jgi:hypothetical protein
VLQYQVGSGAFVSVMTNSYSSSSGSGASLPAIDLSALTELQNVGPGTNVTFRIVNYNGSSSSGTWYIYDVASNSAPDLAIQGAVIPLSGPPAIAPLLSSANVAGDQFQFTLAGTAGSNYVVEISTNLLDGWSPIYTGAAPILFAEPATNGQRFYRGKILP